MSLAFNGKPKIKPVVLRDRRTDAELLEDLNI